MSDEDLALQEAETEDAQGISSEEQPVENDVVESGGRESTEAPSGSAESQSPEESSSSDAWMSTLKDAGFEDFDSVDTAVERAVAAIKQRDKELEQLANQVRFYQDQQKFGSQQQAPASQPSEPESKDPLQELIDNWEDPRWAEQYIEVDENGFRQIKDGVDDVTREKVMAIDRKIRDWGEMLQDPRRFASAVDERVNRMIASRFDEGWQQRQTQQQEQQAIDSFVSENSDWLYERDPATGQYLQDPISGDVRYSQAGQEFLRHMMQAEADGVSSTSRQIAYAQMAMGVRGNQVAQQAQQVRRTATQVAQQRKKDMRGRRNSSPNTQREFNGVSPESGSAPTGASSLSFGEETLSLMKTEA